MPELIPSTDKDIGIFNLWFKCDNCDTLHLRKDDAFKCCGADVRSREKSIPNDRQLRLFV